MRSELTYDRPLAPSLKELPMVLLFSIVFASILMGFLNLPMRFILAGTAGLGVLAASCFIENKRLFYLSLMTLALIVPMNKRILEIHGRMPRSIDVVSISVLDAFLIISYGIWFFTSLRSSKPGQRFDRTLVIPFLGMCAASLFSFTNAPAPMWGVFEVVRMLKTLALYWFLIHNIKDLKEVRWILYFLAIGVLIEFVFCLFEKYVFQGTAGLRYLGEAEQSVHSVVADRIVFRSGGTLGHPNGLAYYLDLLIPLLLTRAFALYSSRGARRFFLLAFAAACGCLYFTQSRGGMVATGISVTLCYLVLTWRNFRLRVFQLQTIALVLLAIIVVGLFSNQIFSRFGKKDAGAFQTRIDQYHVATRMIMKHPWVGVGLNSFQDISPDYDDTAAKVTHIFPEPVHNMYLLALSQTGVIGLAGVIWLVLAILYLARFWPWPYGDIFDLHLGIFCGLIGHFIHANGDPVEIGSYSFLFFLLGLLTVVHQIGLNSIRRAKAA